LKQTTDRQTYMCTVSHRFRLVTLPLQLNGVQHRLHNAGYIDFFTMPLVFQTLLPMSLAACKWIVIYLNVSWFILNTMHRWSCCGCSNTTKTLDVRVVHYQCLAAP